MVHRNLQNLLVEAGLSEAEVMVYIDLIKTPSQNGWELVKRTGLSKSSVYRAIDKLQNLNLIQKKDDGIYPLSLKCFLADLDTKERKIGRLAYKLRQIAPFLSAPHDYVEKFDQFYTEDQVKEAYIFMSELDYHTNLDFGDFESFVPRIGGMDIAKKFRDNRVKHAKHHAICTTFGPYTSYFSTKESAKFFKNKVDLLNSNIRNRFIIFSDNRDYVLYNDVDDEDRITSVLVKSKPIADAQRAQFQAFSQLIGK